MGSRILFYRHFFLIRYYISYYILKRGKGMSSGILRVIRSEDDRTHVALTVVLRTEIPHDSDILPEASLFFPHVY
jgi:hypothetical protein